MPFCLLSENCPKVVLSLSTPDKFDTRGANASDGHETGRQATDLDEHFGIPYRFSRRFRKPLSRGRARPSQNVKFNVSLCLLFGSILFFQAIPCARTARGVFFCARIAQGVWNFLPGAAVLAEHSTEPRGRVAAADAAASAGTSKSEERTETVPSGVRRVPVGLHEGPPVRRFF